MRDGLLFSWRPPRSTQGSGVACGDGAGWLWCLPVVLMGAVGLRLVGHSSNLELVTASAPGRGDSPVWSCFPQCVFHFSSCALILFFICWFALLGFLCLFPG